MFGDDAPERFNLFRGFADGGGGFAVLRYCTANGATTAAANPNGSAENIAGICNRDRNVFGLMPHPERAADARLGSTDGLVFFESILQTLGVRRAA